MSTNRFLNQFSERENKEEKTENKSSSNRFLSQIENIDLTESEGYGKTSFRTGAQVPLGISKIFTWPADLIKLATEGASKEVLSDLIENDPDINKEIAEQARQKGMKYIPTQQLAEHLVEKYTGLPLEPKTKPQEMLRFGSEAATFRPGGKIAKTIAGVTAPVVSESAKAFGLPDWLSDILGFGAAGVIPSPEAKAIIKPSGMKERWFEKIEKPTYITPRRAEKISETVEKDFRNINEKLLSENKTYSQLKENPQLKNEVVDMFEDVEKHAEKILEPIDIGELRDNFEKRVISRPEKGYMPSEFEREFRKETAKIFKRFGDKEISVKNLVEQYRKNNSELSELFEPGKSGAANRAKKEALLEHNRAIEDLINQKYPDSEFYKLFKKSNDYWGNLKAIDEIEEFNNLIFSGKIDYKKAEKIFTDKSMRRSYEKLIGKEGLKNYEILVKDLLSTEKPMGLLKKANALGFKDLFTIGGEYFINPKIAGIHALSKYGKKAFQMILDKPKFAITWENAIQNLKKGKFKESEAGFKKLDNEVNLPKQNQ